MASAWKPEGIERGRGIRCKSTKAAQNRLTLRGAYAMMVKPLIVGFKQPLAAHPAIASLRKRQAEICLQLLKRAVKQYKVQYGDVIYVEKLTANEDESGQFPVIAVCDGERHEDRRSVC